ncbi:hypothetical protein [Lactovum odontotermitis]
MENKLQKLIGQKVVKSCAGGGAGSVMEVDFSDDSYFFIWCTWRIEQGGEVIVTSADTIAPSGYNDSQNGFIGEKVPLLIGGEVVDVKLSPLNDLELLLSNEYRLRIFCDISYSRDDYAHNWEFNIPTKNLSIEVDNHFEIKESPYDNEEIATEDFVADGSSFYEDVEALKAELEELRTYKKTQENREAIAPEDVEAFKKWKKRQEELKAFGF